MHYDNSRRFRRKSGATKHLAARDETHTNNFIIHLCSLFLCSRASIIENVNGYKLLLFVNVLHELINETPQTVS